MAIVQGAVVSSFFVSPTVVAPNFESTLSGVIVGSGEDTVAVVVTGAPRLPTSVKLGGTTMARAVSDWANFAHIYYLTGVAPGTYSVVLEYTSGISWGITAVPLAGVDQSTPIGDTAEDSGLGTSRLLSLSTGSGDYVLGGISVEAAAAPITSGQDDMGGAAGNNGIGDCTVRVQSDAATDDPTTLSWTHSSGWSYAAAAVFLPATAPSGPSLSIDEQPTATQSGYLIDPAPVVHVLDEEGALDTSFTGDVTVSLLGSGGVLLGTLTVAAVAGVATFPNLRPCEAGSYQLRFSASGYANLDSATFAVTAGEGTTILGAPMFQSLPIPQNEGTASRRRIYLDIRNDSNGAWDGSVTGVKAKLTKGGVLVEGNETDSPADIVRVAGRLHYVEVAQGYVNDTVGVAVTARVPAAAGRQEAVSVASIAPSDLYAAGVAEASLVRAMMRAQAGLDGWGMEIDEASGVCRLVIPGVGTQEISAQFGARLQSLLRLGTAPS